MPPSINSCSYTRHPSGTQCHKMEPRRTKSNRLRTVAWSSGFLAGWHLSGIQFKLLCKSKYVTDSHQSFTLSIHYKTAWCCQCTTSWPHALILKSLWRKSLWRRPYKIDGHSAASLLSWLTLVVTSRFSQHSKLLMFEPLLFTRFRACTKNSGASHSPTQVLFKIVTFLISGAKIENWRFVRVPFLTYLMNVMKIKCILWSFISGQGAGNYISGPLVKEWINECKRQRICSFYPLQMQCFNPQINTKKDIFNCFMWFHCG